MSEITKEQLIEHIANMTVLELSELVKELEEKFGVSAAAAAVAAAPAAGGASGGEAAAEEKTEFDVVLDAAGEKKINVIKEIRAITGLGLKEAKEFVESAPKTVKEGCPKEEAEEIVKKLQEAGASASINYVVVRGTGLVPVPHFCSIGLNNSFQKFTQYRLSRLPVPVPVFFLSST